MYCDIQDGALRILVVQLCNRRETERNLLNDDRNPPMLETLGRANELYMHAMVTDAPLKAERLKDDWRIDMIMLMIGLNEAVEAQRNAAGE
ncbi:hypothetical protein PS862_00084 [Pseudomonas fluorescens]|uniref:Uncharacterized protein n=1 Tax=Pseudomonas fluorescens TaxID=294 RepID=A0A5E7G4Q8_PSEFL|nr:hypothetical protein PS862_00084 [Pseudomonas fluorescens]